MKVRGSVDAEVELGAGEQRRIVHRWLSERYDLRVNGWTTHFVRDGKLMQTEVISAGSHSYDEQKILRDATPFDEAVLKILLETRF